MLTEAEAVAATTVDARLAPDDLRKVIAARNTGAAAAAELRPLLLPEDDDG